MKKKITVIYMMICMLLFVFTSESLAGVIQYSFRSQYKNDVWQVVFMENQKEYEDKKDFTIRDGYVLLLDIKVESGSLNFTVEGRKSKTTYADRKITSDKLFSIDSNENVSVTVKGDTIKGSFLIKTIKKEAAEKMVLSEVTDSLPTEVSAEELLTEQLTEQSKEQLEEETEEQSREESIETPEADWRTRLSAGQKAGIYDSICITDKSVAFVQENEQLFTGLTAEKEVSKLKNDDLKYSVIMEDIDRYGDQIISFRVTIDSIEEIADGNGTQLTIMKVHYDNKQTFSLMFIGAETRYTEDQQITVYGIPLGTAVLKGELREESLVCLICYSEVYQKPWYKIF